MSVTIPHYAMSDKDVERTPTDYSIRGKGDYVVSGPLLNRSDAKGRTFISTEDAAVWAKNHFGNRFLYPIKEAEKGGKWAILVRCI